MARNDVNDVSNDASGESSAVTSTIDHMTMSFLVDKTPVTLELAKNDYIPPLPYYYTAEPGGKVVQWALDEEQVGNRAIVDSRLRPSEYCWSLSLTKIGWNLTFYAYRALSPHRNTHNDPWRSITRT